MNRWHVALGVLLTGGMAASGFAQVCVGAPAFANGMVRAGGGVTFDDNVKTYTAQLAVGAQQGPFVEAEAGHADANNSSLNGSTFGGSVGYDMDVSSQVHLCPIAGYSYAKTSDITVNGLTFHPHANVFNVGGSIGTALPLSATVDVAPFFGAAYIHSSASASTPTGNSSSFSVTKTDDYADLGAGFGFITNKVFTIQPRVDVPVGLSGGKANFTLAVGFNFGR